MNYRKIHDQVSKKIYVHQKIQKKKKNLNNEMRKYQTKIHDRYFSAILPETPGHLSLLGAG